MSTLAEQVRAFWTIYTALGAAGAFAWRAYKAYRVVVSARSHNSQLRRLHRSLQRHNTAATPLAGLTEAVEAPNEHDELDHCCLTLQHTLEYARVLLDRADAYGREALVLALAVQMWHNSDLEAELAVAMASIILQSADVDAARR